MGVGDSKTGAATGYFVTLAATDPPLYERPPRLATTGWRMADVYGAIDAALAARVDSPAYVLCNIGVNDASHFGELVEATWKMQYRYVVDAIHTRWPAAAIYLARVWERGFGADCDTVDGWIADVIVGRPFCHVGIDERVYLENGDDGVTYTADGVHPNAAGYVLTAAEWRTAIGL